MHGEIIVAGSSEEEALQEALERLRLPREAVTYEVTSESEDSLLPGAKPQLQVHVRIRPEFVAERAMEHIRTILGILGIDAELESEERHGIIFVRVASKSAASLLIGRDGQNLDALQYLVNRMILKVGREAPMVVIDIEDYRRRTFEKLERLADRAAKRARESGNEIELDPMPAIERKYLHHYLRTMDGLRTFSRGEEPERFLVIIAD
ncbi:MAG: KH domain-containing protein [bacterium]|nr:KH domain-containing protein [bacterium]